MVRGQPHQVPGRFDRRKVPFDGEQAADLGWVVRRVVEPAQPPSGVRLHAFILGVQGGLGGRQLAAVAFHRGDERRDVRLTDEPDAGLDVGQGQSPPVVDDPGADGGEPAEGLVPDVDDLLAGAHEPGVGAVGVADLFFLLRGQGPVDAPPREGDADGGGRAAQPPGGAVRFQRDVEYGGGAHGDLRDKGLEDGSRPVTQLLIGPR
jgi:hypothetical protein